MFTYGDIVKPRFNSGGMEYFIVTDVIDYSKNGDGSQMAYEIMKIYPVSKSSTKHNASQERLSLHAKGTEKEGKMIMTFVMEERAKRGYTEVPDFHTAICNNMLVEKKLKTPNVSAEDVVRYDKLETVNDCLDAMNDLSNLHKHFGDEAYLQLREIAINRLKELV